MVREVGEEAFGVRLGEALAFVVFRAEAVASHQDGDDEAVESGLAVLLVEVVVLQAMAT